MTPDQDDPAFREQFERLKQHDSTLPRPFSEYWDRAQRQAGAGRRWNWNYRLAAAALVLILVAGAIFFFQRGTFPRRLAREEASIAQLSRWRAPTDSLLNTPGSELLRTRPRFGRSDPFLSGIETK